MLKKTNPAAQPSVKTAASTAIPVAVDVLLRLPAVLKIIPVSRAKFYKEMHLGNYPKPLKIGSRISVWRMSTISQLSQSIAT